MYSLIATDSHQHFRTFTIASVAGIFSLFPLLFTPAGKISHSRMHRLVNVMTSESIIQVIYSLLWCFFVLKPLNRRVYWYVTLLHINRHLLILTLAFQAPKHNAWRLDRHTRKVLPCRIRSIASFRYSFPSLHGFSIVIGCGGRA